MSDDVGVPISMEEARRISLRTLENAERERLEHADKEAGNACGAEETLRKERDELKEVIRKIAGDNCFDCKLSENEWVECALLRGHAKCPKHGRRPDCPLGRFL